MVFFDTELLIKTERAGVPIHEQPVTWIEDTDSRVKIVKTAVDDLKGLYRVNKELDKRSWFEMWALPVLLALTGALYLFGALHNGMANSYYATAVQAASQDWTAWLFGSLDAANYVSVDKPPLATMVMGLSARLFGFSSFSMLLPSVLAGVGSVWLVYAAVKRQFGFTSAAIAGAALAFTPVVALMFGFNNPDAILTLMLTASGYAFLRSLEGKRPLLWLGLAGLFTWLAFNTKMLQELMVLPAIIFWMLWLLIHIVIFRMTSGVVACVLSFVVGMQVGGSQNGGMNNQAGGPPGMSRGQSSQQGGPGGQTGGAPGGSQNQTGQSSQAPATQSGNGAAQNNQTAPSGQTDSAQPSTTNTAPQTN